MVLSRIVSAKAAAGAKVLGGMIVAVMMRSSAELIGVREKIVVWPIVVAKKRNYCGSRSSLGIFLDYTLTRNRTRIRSLGGRGGMPLVHGFRGCRRQHRMGR